MGIYNRHNTSDFQVARNISYIPLGNGKYGLDFMRDRFAAMYPGQQCPSCCRCNRRKGPTTPPDEQGQP